MYQRIDPGLRIETEVPDVFENHRLSDRASGMTQQQFEQSKFAGLAQFCPARTTSRVNGPSSDRSPISGSALLSESIDGSELNAGQQLHAKVLSGNRRLRIAARAPDIHPGTRAESALVEKLSGGAGARPQDLQTG
jgi:hypothetical protein